MVVGIAVSGSITMAVAGRLIHASEADDSVASDRIQELEAAVARLSTALDRVSSDRPDELRT